MSIVETVVEIPSRLESNVFGQFDQHVKKIEKTLNVTVIATWKCTGVEKSGGYPYAASPPC